MHVYISSALIKKDNDGKWIISKIYTSKGSFDLPSHISEGLNQKLLGGTMNEIKDKILPQIEEFIKNENLIESKKK